MDFTNAVNAPIKNIDTWVGEKNMFIYKTPEERIDAEAAYLLNFEREMVKKYQK